jgi:hypothetical protein
VGAINVSIVSGRCAPVGLQVDAVPEVRQEGDIAAPANLLTNARQALEKRPQPRRVRLTARAAGEWAQTEVADNGPGIADAVAFLGGREIVFCRIRFV